MFTGLVAGTGKVVSFASTPTGRRLVVDPGATPLEVALGDSIAVNGTCLTLAAVDQGAWAFDLLVETVSRTSLSILAPGSRVNLEGALRAGDRMGGHFVTGHVDGVGTIVGREERGGDLGLVVEPPTHGLPLLVEKGSIAVDGVSLTVARLDSRRFELWLIPHTLQLTNLGDRRAGDPVNLEFDLLAKHVARLLNFRPQGGVRT